MFVRPDAHAAAESRSSFASATVSDFVKVLQFAARQHIVEAREARALTLALETLAAAKVWRPRSELFNAYFAALGAVKGGAPDARAQLLQLGNVLLEERSGRGLDVEVPLRVEAGQVSVPAAGACVRLGAPEGAFTTPEWVEQVSGALGREVAATWHRATLLPLRGATGPVSEAVEGYRRQTSALSGRAQALAALDVSSREGAAVVALHDEACALIERVDPELARELTAVTEYVVLLRGGEFVGASTIRCFGATFLNMQPSWSALCFADHLVHEAAHQLLHTVQERQPLLLNRHFLGAPSPIRSDPRPLYGSFHATFVFLRLAGFMSRVLESGAGQAREAEVRLHRHLLGLLQGLKVLRDDGEFSPQGRHAVDAWAEGARELVRLHGRPSEALCRQLDWDYEPPNTAMPMLQLEAA
ncbi:MAG: hypothetical protein JNK82_26850 [Myxococcaceae bacterium]|nr:hypothetical protein [Myxococcaceae bacterium]